MLRKHPLFILLLIALALLASWYLRTILLYVVVAAIIAMVVSPMDRYLERIRLRKKKLPRGIRAFIMLLTVFAVLGGFIAIFVPLIVDEINILSNIDQQQLQKAIHEPAMQLEALFSRFVQQTGDQRQTFDQYAEQKINSLLGTAQMSSLANSIFSTVSGLITAFFVISFLTFFFLKDGAIIYQMLLLLIPPKFKRGTENIVEDTRRLLTKYFTGVLLDTLFAAAFVGTGMAILGVKNALIIGLFAGILNIIPYVGPLIGGAFAVAVGISTNLHLDFYTAMLPLAGKIMLVFVLMNLTDGFLVQPYIFSNSVKAHPIEIFIVILIAGTLAGIGGMIAAVPTYTILRIIAREFFSQYQFVQRLTDDLNEEKDSSPQIETKQK